MDEERDELMSIKREEGGKVAQAFDVENYLPGQGTEEGWVPIISFTHHGLSPNTLNVTRGFAATGARQWSHVALRDWKRIPPS